MLCGTESLHGVTNFLQPYRHYVIPNRDKTPHFVETFSQTPSQTHVHSYSLSAIYLWEIN